jgi:hypothetical protein
VEGGVIDGGVVVVGVLVGDGYRVGVNVWLASVVVLGDTEFLCNTGSRAILRQDTAITKDDSTMANGGIHGYSPDIRALGEYTGDFRDLIRRH